MEKKKNELDDPYWTSAHTGFSFDDGDLQASVGESTLSARMRRDELNQFHLFKCDGLTEAVQNRSANDFSPYHIVQVEEKNCLSHLSKNFDPLSIGQKRQTESIKCKPEETVRNMILGSEYCLVEYKGTREKISLLNAAIKSHDGNAILEVILFLRDTLKRSIFQREIIAYPDAVNVYLAYLEEDHETDELTNMLLLLDKPEEAAILKYEAAVMVQHPEKKLKWIENCLSTHFQLGTTNIFLRQSVEEHKQILEEQIKLENHTRQTKEVQNLQYFEALTGKKCVIDSSVLCSLLFCCLYYYNSGEFQLNFPSPEKIKFKYNLSKKQYTWTALRALTALKRWSDIDDLFKIKNWLGGTKVRSCIAYSRILEVLFKAEAPNEVLKKYVSCVENEDEKLLLAKRYACHSIAIEIYKNNKDRVGLSEYKASLLPHSVDFCIATDILNNPAIRWKN